MPVFPAGRNAAAGVRCDPGGAVSNEYPSAATLRKIRRWPIATSEDCVDLLRFIESEFRWADRQVRRRGRRWSISTGGWSGNEDLVAALQCNLVFWAICWMKSERGGHFVFEAPRVSA